MIHLIGARSHLGQAVINAAENVDIYSWTRSSVNPLHYFDLFKQSSWCSLLNKKPNTVILLPWPGLPNYNNSYHLTRNLPAYVQLIPALISSGCKNIISVGTCYEYGIHSGSLSESLPSNPINLYALAKDSFRRSLQILCNQHDVRWTWSRVFYVYGPGQRSSSLYTSLLDAISKNKPYFEMSSGRQLRDFVQSDAVARHLLFLATNPESSGIFNCGSGTPTTLFEFVDSIVAAYDSDIKVVRNSVPDRLDEPFAFWADMSKFNSLLRDYHFY